jgi:photoactive yellow protein
MDSRSPMGIVCAWCRKEMRAGAPGAPVSHGICAECSLEQGGIDVEDVVGMTAEQADALPWGRIRLRGTGEIEQFNLAESRLAGRQPAEVIGKHFFRDVAPCARVVEFEGRLQAMRARHESGHAETEFVFRFPGGAQHVSVRILYSADDDTAILLLRRTT